MSRKEPFAEAVYFFQDENIVSEMLFTEFESVLNQAAGLDQFAASIVRCAYAAVGTGLAVRGVVCFQLNVDEEGMADPGFNIPLRHLLRHGGSGPDLGAGAVRLACRGQCSVPWHANNLWDPQESNGEHPVVLIQRAVWRNRLGLKLVPQQFDELSGEVSGEGNLEQKQLEQKITETFGVDGKLSLQQLIRQNGQQVQVLQDRFRTDMERQQQIYLDQVRDCRSEIQRLKGLLRQEQNRNKRLQQLLRGEMN